MDFYHLTAVLTATRIFGEEKVSFSARVMKTPAKTAKRLETHATQQIYA